MSADEDGTESPRDAAINWWMRRKEGKLGREAKAAFEAWLAADPANHAAYDDIARMCGDLERLRPSRSIRAPRRASAGLRLAGALVLTAACIALTAGFDDLSSWLRSDYRAGTGETKHVLLEDGSRIELDARSAIAIDYGATRRRITLLRGEAWFSVAADPLRPFVVEAASGTVTALGTAFDIALDPALGKGEARVAVTEHRVRVSSGGREVVLEEGQETAYARDLPARAPSRADVARLTAWRRGKLIVENEPLGNVLSALSRYRHGYVVCLKPSICARRVSGVFGTEDPRQAVAEIETYLRLKAFLLGDYLVVLHD